MIQQFDANIPEGKSTPDFQSKPDPVNIKEGGFHHNAVIFMQLYSHIKEGHDNK